MPVRKIPRNYQNITGRIAKHDGSTSAAFESSLEKDFYTLIDFDLNVDRFEEQPVTIEYTDSSGKLRKYTPDVLVLFRKDIVPACNMKPWLCEIKYSDDIIQNISNYEPKFKAAKAYAQKRGWQFKIMTEHEIRTPFLENVKFLRGYRKIPSVEENTKLILDALHEMRETDPETLLLAIYEDKWRRAELMPYLWKLLSNRQIGVDLKLKLTMKSRIWYLDPLH